MVASIAQSRSRRLSRDDVCPATDGREAIAVGISGDGRVTVDFGGNTSGAYAVTEDGLGHVVLAGISSSGSAVDMAVLRLTDTGALDTTFSGDGRTTVDFAGDSDEAGSVAVDGLGRIVLGGFTNIGGVIDFAVARLTDAGALDSAFGSGGKATVNFGGTDEIAAGMAVDGLGRIVLAGYAYFGNTYDFAIARLTADDPPAFGTDGKATNPLPGDQFGYAVAVDRFGRTLVAGELGGDFAVTRFTAAGVVDASFGVGGTATINFPGRRVPGRGERRGRGGLDRDGGRGGWQRARQGVPLDRLRGSAQLQRFRRVYRRG